MAPQSSRSSSSSRTTHRALISAEAGTLSQISRVRASRRAAAPANASTAPSSKLSSRQTGGTNTTGSLRSGKVETNLRSYDRRDPFAAISTLIKLFTTLPSRVIAGGGGGCQYKLLTIDEHKLCMHLCNIVEPFILSATHCEDIGSANGGNLNALFKRRILLMRQPTEILDRIASFVENREDLMNFGLTCKRLSEIVFPRHWEYRIIRAKVSMVGVWKHLCERSDLAANVRVVEVVDERSDKRLLVPRVCRKAMAAQGNKSSVTGPAGGVKAEEVVSATSSEEASSASGSEAGENIGVAAKKVSIHKRQEKYFVAALERMSDLHVLKWEANHSPMSALDDDGGMVWKTLVGRCGSLGTLEVVDNKVFSPLMGEDDDGDEQSTISLKPKQSALIKLRSITLRATQFPYGTPKEPSMSRIATVLHQCPNIENLEIVFRRSKTSTTALPVANEFLTYGRWSHLTSLTLTNLSCFTPTSTLTSQSVSTAGTSAVPIIQLNPLQTFLSVHSNLEVLKITDISPVASFRRLRAPLPPNTLPKLKELHAGKDIINMILRSNCDTPRPLEVLKGFKLACASGFVVNSVDKCSGLGGGNVNANTEFYQNLKRAGGTIKRIELDGWGDLDDVKMLAHCAPKLTWLDVGRRLRPANNGSTSANPSSSTGAGTASGGWRGQAQAPVTNMVEWTEVLSGFEELTTFHGVKFFYEISPSALPNGGTTTNDTSTGSGLPIIHPPNPHLTISMTDRSRIKKNDEIAGVLAWKCPKLKRVDHWESAGPSGGKVIVLFRDADFGPNSGESNLNKVRWDVRRIRA
ncbi:hypothetical protein D9756_008165 [Leucocoprinus leucothites]|uniref:F-box domain-containing protein n=1 Tax=Leucocoprinus leucothites TaxID=201217 RepID=A0A8H5FW09_9AGAR|nr:hypothetical protein D9756_008165 [Leucoagaricus leucothites]